ncbi:MAG: hypothetical protein O9282_02950 [Flavobacterium sp.]|uniref:nucleotidyltransferase domain-containing protein n=1 Tax=Flavobacterium sp. TaxID=239 RepID=UPI0022BD63F3|nr:nucleotidyltransferase domain-containing protein [Flavobacterium sp.]MCZ8330251.1 hypothetical protein [Flavobacterium sp.]
MNEKKTNLDELISFVKRQFPEADAALLTGSFGTKKEKNNSDIDLIIFSESISQSFVEKFIIDSQKYDVIYLSTHYNYLINELYSDVFYRYGVFANMISNSKILIDKKDFLKDVIYFSKNILIKGYGKLSYEEIEFKTKLISNALEDIIDIETVGEFYFSSSLITEEITNLVLSYNSKILGRGKIKAHELEKVDPKLYHRLINSIMKYDKEEFIKIIKEELDFFGGVLTTYSPKDIPSINSKDVKRYDILIKKKYYKNALISTNYTKLIEFLNKNNINLLYFYFLNDNLIICIDSIKIDGRLSRSITNWLASSFRVETKDKIIIKPSKNKLIPFVSKEINDVLENDLILFTKFCMGKKIFKNNFDVFKFSYQIVSEIINDLFVEDKKSVYEYLYHSNILNGVNLDSSRLNYFQLIDYRIKIVEEIEILSKTLSLVEINDSLFENHYSLEFPKTMTKISNKDLNLLKGSVFSDEKTENKNNEAKLLLLNFYLNYLLDILDSNNQLSIIANILKKQS